MRISCAKNPPRSPQLADQQTNTPRCGDSLRPARDTVYAAGSGGRSPGVRGPDSHGGTRVGPFLPGNLDPGTALADLGLRTAADRPPWEEGDRGTCFSAEKPQRMQVMAGQSPRRLFNAGRTGKYLQILFGPDKRHFLLLRMCKPYFFFFCSKLYRARCWPLQGRDVLQLL